MQEESGRHIYLRCLALRCEMYFGQAAQIRGDTLEVKGQLLRELLTESNEFGYLMGSGGPGAQGGQPAFTPSL